MQANVFLSAAPLVEGAMAAAVQASVGATVAQVLAEAQSALAVKAEQLGQEPADSQPTQTAARADDEPNRERLTIIVRNQLGLHARPAARFVTIANQFTADMTVSKDGQTANAKSINQVATLGVRQGDTITILAGGPDAKAALAAIQTLADDNFGDADEAEAPQMPTQSARQATSGVPGALSGIPASPGIAIGPAALYRPSLPDVTARTADDPTAEWQRLQEAIDAAIQEINALQRQAVRQVGRARGGHIRGPRARPARPRAADSRSRTIGRQQREC